MCRSHYHFDRNTLGGMKGASTPGPGNYRLPSDFGYYEAKKKYTSTRGSPVMSRSASQPIINK